MTEEVLQMPTPDCHQLSLMKWNMSEIFYRSCLSRYLDSITSVSLDANLNVLVWAALWDGPGMHFSFSSSVTLNRCSASRSDLSQLKIFLQEKDYGKAWRWGWSSRLKVTSHSTRVCLMEVVFNALHVFDVLWSSSAVSDVLPVKVKHNTCAVSLNPRGPCVENMSACSKKETFLCFIHELRWHGSGCIKAIWWLDFNHNLRRWIT